MATLQSTNVQGTLCVNGVAIGGGKDFYFCCFTTSGTWSPSSDLVNGNGGVEATIIGAGGGGGGGYGSCAYGLGGAGGGGEVIHKLKKVTATTACCRVIGGGGSYGYANCHSAICASAGGKGGNSCILGECAYGGGGGGSVWAECNTYNVTTLCNGNVAGGPSGGRAFGGTNNEYNNKCYCVGVNGGQGANRSDRQEQTFVTYTCCLMPTNYEHVTVTYNEGTVDETHRIGLINGSGWNGFAGAGATSPGVFRYNAVDGGGCGMAVFGNVITTTTTCCAGDATSCGAGGGAASSSGFCRNYNRYRGGNGANGLIILKWAQ